MIRNDKIEVLVFVDPATGLTCAQALEVLAAVESFNGNKFPLYRLTLTGANSTTTQWSDMMPFLESAKARPHLPALRIFGNLVGLTPALAKKLAQRKVKVYGEWSASSLCEQGVTSMTNQGFELNEALSMRSGINIALQYGILQGLEFQITSRNIARAGDFLQFCQSVGIEGHLEMKEVPFFTAYETATVTKTWSHDYKLSQAWIKYRNTVPVTADISKLASHPLVRLVGENPVPPFLCPGASDPRGSCPYFYRGLFLWSNGGGDLFQTVCLSDRTVVGERPFQPTAERIAKSMEILSSRRNVEQDQMNNKCRACEQWSHCLGGCRAMAYLNSEGDQFAVDPNCWR